MTRTYVEDEIASQPQTWSEAAELASSVSASLPAPGERVAFVGCGTSWFVAMAVAVRRESLGLGESDAFAASEFPAGRAYDRVVAISRSGTTTEVMELLSAVDAPTTLITAVPDSPATALADATVALAFADEQSVVQTRFATSVIALLRSHFGDDLTEAIADARTALTIDVERLVSVDQCTFVATGWAVGLTSEAALKTREAAQFWAESYPAMDYRHGPIAIAQPGRLVWNLGGAPKGLAEEVAATGAEYVSHDLDPLAALVVAQRFAVALAVSKGLDPDRPRSLTRSVILT
ncbi:fructoselysine-6-P-deglycase FrlB-like protein [Microbacterium ginsengiterrae]|uniref:Fructoselysine-6-P-deglycase FrlB-like protein n=1 Tax=Microbacterium ginsengiterrae TaxID=546115 RepID=A0A7W9CCE3_9MICO|nr:SIS domain-containing protein [Microbacterium ginsengiterrae]MBB5743017.1 fructoselysine-6-P-deglycase FrlB-like protein [Microbacterium ginsengiterrae]